MNDGWAPLVDVGDMSLAELVETVDGPILDATRRIVADLDDPNGVQVAGFSSAI